MHVNECRAGASLAERVRGGGVSLGVFVNLGSSLATEVLALAGFDWLLVDLEHGAGGESALLSQVHASAAHQVPVVARVETADRIRVGRVLDLGVHGVMLPRLDGALAAKDAVAALHYPPAGTRGVATYNRSKRFGQDQRPLSEVNDSVLSVVQIESVAALAEVEAIAATSGADVLFVGPSDLSVSMGVGGQLDSEAFQDALRRVVAAAAAAGVRAGILAADVDSALRYVEQGFTFVAVSSDAALLLQGAGDVVRGLRGKVEQLQPTGS